LTENFHGEEMSGSMSGFENLLLSALGDGGLTGRIPDWLLNCRKLQVLDLSWHNLQSSIPSWFCQLEGLFSLDRNQSANGLQYNQASSFPPSILLSNNRTNGSIWPEIGCLRQLPVLDLSRNNITGTISSSISNNVNLEMLDVKTRKFSKKKKKKSKTEPRKANQDEQN
ncbi:phytosulfokine receptor 2, partial [Dorcoceras hygrometricum]